MIAHLFSCDFTNPAAAKDIQAGKLPYWKELSIPTLVMYGSDDPNVPAEASKARLVALNKENIIVNIYEGSEHALQDPPGMGNNIFRDEALMDIRNFIDTVVSSDS